MEAFAWQMKGACGKWALLVANGKAPVANRQMLVANGVVLGTDGGILVANWLCACGR